MSALTDAIAKLESGGSTNQGASGGYVNYRYQQFQPFVSQYGFGEAGINNYASQVLQSNPNATFGDLYGGYVTGTGNPASASMSSLLTTTQPGAQGAYQNLISNSPIDPNTPLSSLVGDTGATGAPNYANNIFDTGTTAVPYSGNTDPLGVAGGGSGPAIGYFGQNEQFQGAFPQNSSQFSSVDTAGQFTQDQSGQFPLGDLNSGNFSNSGTVAPDASGQLGTGALSAGGGFGFDPAAGTAGDLGSGASAGGVDASSLFGGIASGLGGLVSGNSSSSGGQTFFAWLGDWAIRGAVILLGFIFIVAGLFLLKGNLVIAPELGPIAGAAKKVAKAGK